MTLLVQTPHKEELKEYFTPPKSLDYNEDGRLENNKEVYIHIRRCCKMGNWIL